MSVKDGLGYLALWSSIGAFLFSVFVVFVFRSGAVYTSRKEDGTLKEKVPLRGYLTMGAFLLIIVGFLVLANYLSLARTNVSLGFGGLFLLNMALYLILFLFDTLIIDGFVLAYWRPGFLNLSDQMGHESMREHIIRSIPVGTVFGLLISGLSTVISFLTIMR
jgi:hypothetical protein